MTTMTEKRDLTTRDLIGETTMATTWTHTFAEQGNGFPGIDEDVICDDDGDISLLTVVSVSPIHTQQWQANMVYLECKESDTDWDDLSEAQQDRLYNDLCHVSGIGEDEDEDA